MGNLSHTLILFAQQSVSQAKPGAEEPSLISPWMMGLFVVLILGLPFLLGNLIARWIKMKDMSTKISVILLALILGMSPFVSQYVIGWEEQGRYDEDLSAWKEKQKYRDQISADGIAELKAKAKVPGLEVRWQAQKAGNEK